MGAINRRADGEPIRVVLAERQTRHIRCLGGENRPPGPPHALATWFGPSHHDRGTIERRNRLRSWRKYCLAVDRSSAVAVGVAPSTISPDCYRLVCWPSRCSAVGTALYLLVRLLPRRKRIALSSNPIGAGNSIFGLAGAVCAMCLMTGPFSQAPMRAIGACSCCVILSLHARHSWRCRLGWRNRRFGMSAFA